MKIVEALISEIREDVTTRDVCGGIALMHGKLTMTAVAILDDGRCVKFRLSAPAMNDKTLYGWNEWLPGRELNPADIIEDLSTPSSQPKEIEI